MSDYKRKIKYCRMIEWFFTTEIIHFEHKVLRKLYFSIFIAGKRSLQQTRNLQGMQRNSPIVKVFSPKIAPTLNKSYNPLKMLTSARKNTNHPIKIAASNLPISRARIHLSPMPPLNSICTLRYHSTNLISRHTMDTAEVHSNSIPLNPSPYSILLFLWHHPHTVCSYWIYVSLEFKSPGDSMKELISALMQL